MRGDGQRAKRYVNRHRIGKRLAGTGEALGITVKAVARGRDGKFLPAGI
jgi:hypothetical protein